MSRLPSLPPAAVIVVCLGLIVMAPVIVWANPAPAGSAAVTDTMVVHGTRSSLGESRHLPAAGESVDELLQSNPFQLIRRGTTFLSDLYADGLKRNDLTLTIDGERFTTACPNRMDTRIAHVDLMDIEAITLSRTGGSLQSGLGGKVAFRRRPPGQDQRVYGQLGAGFDHQEDYDLHLAVENQGVRVAGRYRRGQPYTDAEGRTYQDIYQYTKAPWYTIAELRAHLAWKQGDGRAAFETSEDLLFPYLKMDERHNDHWQLSASHHGHRAYFNRTEHVMDNDLRLSRGKTDMRTDAINTMFGVVGDIYEVYGRHWDARNYIIPVMNPAMAQHNHMLPDVWRFGAAISHRLGDEQHPWLVARAGVIHTQVGDDALLAKYQTLEAEAKLERWSVPFGATLSHLLDLTRDLRVGISGEMSADAPGVEQQFIAVTKPGTTPDWLGNPLLKDPLRTTARLELQHTLARLDVFGSRIWNYPYLTRRTVDSAAYQTYTGIDAVLAGAHLSASWRMLAADLSWNWGEKVDGKTPLAEIEPLRLGLTAEVPLYEQTACRVRYVHSAGQDRVDPDLQELTTGAWNRLDLGLVLADDDVRVSLEFENVTNVLYTRHLSYLRSPFASGLRVYDPGRTFRITAAFGY